MWVADSSGRPGGPIHLQRKCDMFRSVPQMSQTPELFEKSHGPAPALENSAALQMNQSFTARGPSLPLRRRISHYLSVWMRHPPVEFPLIIPDVHYNGPVSGFTCLSTEETDGNTPCFIKEYGLIWHEPTARSLARSPHCEMIIGSTVSFAFCDVGLTAFLSNMGRNLHGWGRSPFFLFT